MKIIRLSLFVVFLALALLGCKGSEKTKATKVEDKGPALLTFDNGVKVYKSEFEYVYQKNNGGWEKARTHETTQYEEYLDLYINFKRKVMEAESLGLNEKEEFKTEFEGYRKQLAQPYLVEKDFQEGLVKEAYDRSKWLISASHLLIGIGPDASPADTLKAFNKALAIRDSIANKNKDFAMMAGRHSSDPSAKQNGGYLGYFSAFDMVYPFETGAFNTPKGQVSMPVRSGYGYHLILVKDRIENTGVKSAAHIIIRIGPQYSAKDTAMAIARINEISEKIKQGEKFADLAAKFSDDQVTAQKGGDLGTGRLIPEMEELKLKLKQDEVSEPFNTSFGWHLLAITNVEPMQSFEEAEPGIRSKISRDARSYLSREVLMKRVKKENNYQLNQANLDKFVLAVEDETKYTKGFWRPVDSLHKDLYSLELYRIGKDSDTHIGTLKDYIDFYVSYRKGFDGATIKQVTGKVLEKFEEQEVLKFEESQLPKKYPEYRELVKEYRDGILLFTLTEDKVWRKAVEDTVGLKNYYETHKDKFQANERIVVKEYQSDDSDNLQRVLEMLSQGLEDDKIQESINQGSSLNLKVRRLTYEKGKNEPQLDLWAQPVGYKSGITQIGEQFMLAIVMEKNPAGTKSFSDAKSECITQYQNYLEETWLKDLAGKYPVTRHDNVLNQLFK